MDANAPIVIVGGGIAGLASAYELVKDGFTNITLLEKDAQLGGRILTVRGTHHDQPYMYEAGAGRINSTHKHMIALVAELGLRLLPMKKGERAFKPTKTTNATNATNAKSNKIYTDMIKTILDQTKTTSKEVLKRRTFGEVAAEILGSEKAALLRSIFGYNAEFDVANAYDARKMFKRDFQGNAKYFMIEGGFDSVTNALVERIKQKHHGVTIKTQCLVQHITYMETARTVSVNYLDTSFKSHTLTAASVICALPKAALKQLFPEHNRLLSSVASIPLNRAYGFVDPAWLQTVPRTSTDSRIRQFIPIDPTSGLAMLSYTDTKDADYWARHTDSATMNKQLGKIFTGSGSGSGFSGLTHHYWEAGVHYWRKRYDSEKIYERVMFLKGRDVPIYVVGEAYSDHQAWAEGALETVHTLLKNIDSL